MCTDSFTIIAAVTTTGLLLLLVILIVVITSIVCTARVAMRRKQHNRGLVVMIVIVSYINYLGVIDHVPVDDNPAYITMKRITLNKNTAYETVTIRDCHNETVNTSHYENV